MNVNLVSMEEIMRLLLGLEEMSSISFPISIEIILVSIVYLKFFKVSLPGFEIIKVIVIEFSGNISKKQTYLKLQFGCTFDLNETF